MTFGTTVVTGGTGLVGRSLCRILALDGKKLKIITRNPQQAAQKIVFPAEFIRAKEQPIAKKDFAEIDSLVHLAGESIAAKRWSKEQRELIRSSRLDGLRNLLLNAGEVKSIVVISAIGYYGDRADEELNEDSSKGDGFLSDLCADIESLAQELKPASARLVIIRVGLVLAADGGLLEKFLPPFKAGLGGRLGSGRQWMSWVHIDDLVRIIKTAINDDSYEGIYNAVAPAPVRNSQFSRCLGEVLSRPVLFPVPKQALQLGLGSMANEILGSQKVLPQRLLQQKFEFNFDDIDKALADVAQPSLIYAKQRWHSLPLEKLVEKITDASYWAAGQQQDSSSGNYLQRFRISIWGIELGISSTISADKKVIAFSGNRFNFLYVQHLQPLEQGTLVEDKLYASFAWRWLAQYTWGLLLSKLFIRKVEDRWNSIADVV